jgi:CarD family transcriptional regulator
VVSKTVSRQTAAPSRTAKAASVAVARVKGDKAARPPVKAPARPAAKAAAKPVAKIVAKPAAKAAAKPVAKAVPRASAKPVAPVKPVAKMPARPVAKAPAGKPEAAKPMAAKPAAAKPVAAKLPPAKPAPAKPVAVQVAVDQRLSVHPVAAKPMTGPLVARPVAKAAVAPQAVKVAVAAPPPAAPVPAIPTIAPRAEVAAAPPAPAPTMPQSHMDRRPGPMDRIPPRVPSKAEIFIEGDYVVYPTHGVGKVERIATEEIAGHKLELIHITFEENRMTLRVPVAKARSAGLRKLATRKLFDEAMGVLKGRARIKRTMWSRRAQEYEAKINSGDPLAIAEVVRDLHRNAGQPDQSFSERQIYEAAMDRLAAELAALDKTDKPTAVTKLGDFLKTVA